MKIWVVSEEGCEYSVPVRAFLTEDVANAERNKMQRESKGLFFSVTEIELCETNCPTAEAK